MAKIFSTKLISMSLSNGMFRLATQGPKSMRLEWKAPSIEIDGTILDLTPASLKPAGKPQSICVGISEYHLRGRLAGNPDISLGMVIRVADESPVIRFRYELRARMPHKLTKKSGKDTLAYLSVPAADVTLTEVQLSVFHKMVHSFMPNEHTIDPREVENGLSAMGPILLRQEKKGITLLAYEHGSQVPDAFLQFKLTAGNAVTLEAVKGNYLDGQALSAEHPFQTIWFQAAIVAGGNVDSMAHIYREFVLRWMSSCTETRKPYIFYNTWNFQERNKWCNGRDFQTDMNQAHMLKEIDIAAKMGAEVFVLDAGWSHSCGDWILDPKKFDANLTTIKAALDARGMKLGLWFAPRMVDLNSKAHAEMPETQTSWRGKASEPYMMSDPGKTVNHCTVSRFGPAFAATLIRLNKETGATYFKLDGVVQTACDAAGHGHGEEHNSPQERGESHAFQMATAMTQIAETVCAACPGAIVDFDVTEGDRPFGLSYLAAGKYFHVNNGPYLPDYDHPYDWAKATVWSNVFIHPGPARGWVARAPLTFDRWIPTILLMAHYLPDPPAQSQWINIGSLILGQNGIWGDLLSLGEDDIERFNSTLKLYKQIRDDINASFPVRQGATGADPEVHEKILDSNGHGAVVLFAATKGRYTYVTQHTVDRNTWTSPGVTVSFDTQGRAVITVDIDAPSAGIVLFGVGERKK